MKRLLAATASTAIVLGGSTLLAAPAHAGNGPVVTGGLVNVTVANTDVLNNVDVLNNSPILNNVNVLNDSLNDNKVGVGVAANIAAAVCGTNVGGILGALRANSTYTCPVTTAGGVPLLTITQ